MLGRCGGDREDCHPEDSGKTAKNFETTTFGQYELASTCQ